MTSSRPLSPTLPDQWLPAPKVWGPGALVVSSLVPTACLVAVCDWMGNAAFRENGPVETLQAMALLVSFGLFLATGLRSRGFMGWIYVVLASTLLLAFQREVPNCASAYYEGGLCAGGKVKAVLVALAGLMVVAASVLFRFAWRDALRVRNLIWLWPLGLMPVLLGVSAVAEHLILLDVEELTELAAYAYLLAFAAWAWRSVHARGKQSGW